MCFTKGFWDAAAPIINVTEQHPFLVAMVDGTLSMDAFRYYVVQDALYLSDFADCLLRLSESRGISKSESMKLQAMSRSAGEAELQLHEGFFVQWNISANGVDQMPHSLLYTSYMQRIVATRCHAEGLAVLLPCFWVYMHVGKKMLDLRQTLGERVQRPPQFDAWIDMYGGDEFEKAVMEYIELVENAGQQADEATVKEMRKHFLMCCKLEHMFWDQALAQMTWPQSLQSVA